MKKFIFILLLQCTCASLFAQNTGLMKKLNMALMPEGMFVVELMNAEAGKAKSQCLVAWYYEEGKATQCTAECGYNLNAGTRRCRIHGDTKVQSYESAFYWYTQAAMQGNVDAQVKLGEYYRDGKGVGQDYNESFYWYKQAADNKDTDAQYYIGEYYEQGTGIAQDSNEAFNWYLKAAKKNSDAQYKVGVCYDEGIGVAQNSSKAIKYWKKAAKDGNYFAQKALDEHGKK